MSSPPGYTTPSFDMTEGQIEETFERAILLIERTDTQLAINLRCAKNHYDEDAYNAWELSMGEDL